MQRGAGESGLAGSRDIRSLKLPFVRGVSPSRSERSKIALLLAPNLIAPGLNSRARTCGTIQRSSMTCKTAECKADIKGLKSPFSGLRFHDLRHQCVTELAEQGVPEQTLMAIAGHISRRMLDHYSHARLAAKEPLWTGLRHILRHKKRKPPRSLPQKLHSKYARKDSNLRPPA